MRSVLVLEDDSLLRSAISRVLAEMPETEIESAGTLHEALDIVRKRQPDLIVADLELPDGSGVELLQSIGSSVVPFIFVSGYLPDYMDQLSQHPSVTVREKPMPMRELQTLVMAKLNAAALDQVSPFSAADYVQLSCMGRHSVFIDVESAQLRGRIYIRKGSIWAADVGEMKGAEAFYRLAFVEDATVRCTRAANFTVSRNIEEDSWEFLMLEAARKRDEAQDA